MKTRCPQCGFEGTIKDELIPDGGRTVGCPKCKTNFSVKKESADSASPPDTPLGTDPDIYGRDFILAKQKLRDIRSGKGDAGVRATVFSLAFVAVFILGLLIGRYTHDYSFTNPFTRVGVPPAAVMTPVSPLRPGGESTALPTAPPTTVPAPNSDAASEVPTTEPLILEESFTSDVYLDITEVDGEVNKETDVTGVQRELELKEYGEGLVGKNLVGYFIIRDVGTLSPSFGKMLPRSLYSYYIEAESDSDNPIKDVVYVGLKEAGDLASSLDKGAKVFIQGYIYSCALSSDHFELGLVNPRVEPNR